MCRHWRKLGGRWQWWWSSEGSSQCATSDEVWTRKLRPRNQQIEDDMWYTSIKHNDPRTRVHEIANEDGVDRRQGGFKIGQDVSQEGLDARRFETEEDMQKGYIPAMQTQVGLTVLVPKSFCERCISHYIFRLSPWQGFDGPHEPIYIFLCVLNLIGGTHSSIWNSFERQAKFI
jgi:hypothetical protein